MVVRTPSSQTLERYTKQLVTTAVSRDRIVFQFVIVFDDWKMEKVMPKSSKAATLSLIVTTALIGTSAYAQNNDIDAFDGNVTSGCATSAVTQSPSNNRTGNQVSGNSICIGQNSRNNNINAFLTNLGDGSTGNVINGESHNLANISNSTISGTRHTIGINSRTNIISGNLNTAGTSSVSNNISGQFNEIGDSTRANLVGAQVMNWVTIPIII